MRMERICMDSRNLSPQEIVELCEKTVNGKYGVCSRYQDGNKNILLISVSLDKLPKESTPVA
jgi:hypothetical protein